jgi:hypothetical protein
MNPLKWLRLFRLRPLELKRGAVYVIETGDADLDAIDELMRDLDAVRAHRGCEFLVLTDGITIAKTDGANP